MTITVVIVAGGLLLLLVIFKTDEPANYTTGTFGDMSLKVEIVRTEAERERGLSGRESVSGDYGMLFVFSSSDIYGFWMKDMMVPIDIFWLDPQGHVVSIAKEVATSTYPNVFYPSAPVRYVLETAAGFANLHNIATGTPLNLQSWPAVLK